MSTPAQTVLTFQEFLTKNSMTLILHPSYSPNHTPVTFFVSPDEKSPQKEIFCLCGKGEKKTAEALKGIKIDELKNCFHLLSGKNVSISVLHHIESTMKVTEV